MGQMSHGLQCLRIYGTIAAFSVHVTEISGIKPGLRRARHRAPESPDTLKVFYEESGILHRELTGFFTCQQVPSIYRILKIAPEHHGDNRIIERINLPAHLRKPLSELFYPGFFFYQLPVQLHERGTQLLPGSLPQCLGVCRMVRKRITCRYFSRFLPATGLF